MTANGRQGVLRLDALAEAPFPVLVLWGDADAVLPVAQARAIPTADIRILPGKGHMLHAEAPRTVAGAVSDTVPRQSLRNRTVGRHARPRGARAPEPQARGARMIRSAVLALAAATLLAAPAFAGDAIQVRDLLKRKTVTWANQAFDVTRMRDGYRLHGNAPLWVDGTQLTPRGVELVNELARAYEDGLAPNDYLSGISGFYDLATSAEAAKVELAMTAAFLAMGQDLYSGVTTPSVTAKDIVIRKKPVDWAQWIDLVGRNGVKSTFRRLRPNHPQYAQLRQLLRGYRALAVKGGWEPVAGGPTIKPGASDPRVVQIRRNLRARGYDGVERAADPSVHDADLVEAVEHFQERHGLAVDGWAGPNTVAAMNVPASERVKQLAVNLERWRWLPRNLGRRHVLVNQAGFELFLKDGRRTVDNRRVIVGKPYHKTPIFSDEIVYAEFNPTWTIPASILGKEMLPKIRRTRNT